FSHLVTLHGYLEVDGALLPRPAALGRLWERVLTSGDELSHARLVQIYGESGAPAAYVAALEHELTRRLPLLGGDIRPALEPLRRCLSAVVEKDGLIRQLVRAGSAPARDLGRELLVPE